MAFAGRQQQAHLRRFERFDCLAESERLQELAEEVGCTVVCMDIGGNRELEYVTRLLTTLQCTLRPRLVIVKSEALLKAALAHLRALDAASACLPDEHASAEQPAPRNTPAEGVSLQPGPPTSPGNTAKPTASRDGPSTAPTLVTDGQRSHQGDQQRRKQPRNLMPPKVRSGHHSCVS